MMTTTKQHRERLSPSLLAELYDLEEDAYRVSIREAKRIGSGPPAIALRTVTAHANASLDEIPHLAKVRHVRLGSMRSLAIDTFHRACDVVITQFADHEHAYRRALATLHKGIDLVQLVHAAALDEGDDDLAAWCKQWLTAREQLVNDAAKELRWFAEHPIFARLTTEILPAT
jgi:hypothetical protein